MLELNKVYNADSYIAIKDIPDKSIDCIYTDIPYLYVKGGVCKSSAVGRSAAKMRAELKGIKDGIDYKIFNDFIRICKKFNCFIWCSRLQLNDILNFFIPHGYLFNILVWTKTNPIPTCNQRYLEDIEFCIHFRESGVKLNNGYSLKSKWFNSAINQNDKWLFEHPTIKPLQFVKRHLLHATQPNDIIFDPFSGSGTTAVAAKETGRQYIAIEIEKEFYRISQDRIKGITASGQYSLFGEVI